MVPFDEKFYDSAMHMPGVANTLRPTRSSERRNRWVQTLPGKYIRGNEVVEVSYIDAHPGTGWLISTKNSSIPENYFNEIDEVDAYLKEFNVPPIEYPERTNTDNKWVKYDIKHHSRGAWYKSDSSGNCKVLSLNKWKAGDYSLMVWDTSWEYGRYSETVFWYMNTFGTIESDVVIALAEEGDHGASGMEKVWRCETIEEIQEVLTSLGITDDVSSLKEDTL